MTDERRYQDEEVAEIFEAAATPQRSNPRALSSGDGLTLEQLQEIGREVGVAPERIAAAATALDLRRSALPQRTNLGMTISASRAVSLPRAPTDREWELLVGELRETFQAQGKDGSQGGVRQWTNGNLHASIEPTEDCYRLRMGTLKGSAAAVNMMGITGILVGLIMLVSMVAGTEAAVALLGPLIFLLFGVSVLGYNALALPRWAAEREEQMEYITGRAQALIGPAAREDGNVNESGG